MAMRRILLSTGILGFDINLCKLCLALILTRQNRCAESYLQIIRMVIIARKTLFQFAHIKETILRNAPTELSNQNDMLGHVARQLPKFGILFNEALHVCNGIHLSISLAFRGVLFDVIFSTLTQISKV